MDISGFSSDNFDIKEWINETLKPGENQEKDRNYTLGLVMKLQLYIQQVNNSLEFNSQQVLASLPKIIKDTNLLQIEALTLKQEMEHVKQEIAEIEQDTRKSIDSIEKLDKMKSKLTESKQGLHESDNWIVLVNNLEEIFDSRNIEEISNRIIGMQNSLKLLINVADYEDRKLQLEGLKNRLEAIASPLIVQSFTNGDTEQSIKFVNVFAAIGRIPQLLKYYHNCQKDLLLRKWQNQLEIDEPLIQLIHSYYNMLISNWHNQIKWFNQVFIGISATENLINIYVDVLNSLDPTLNESVDAALKQTQDKLEFLMEIKETTKQFAEKMYEVVQVSYSDGKIIDEKKIDTLLKAIYNYLVVYISKYGTYEQSNLIKQLNTINCMKDELSDTVEALGLSVNSVMDFALEAKKECVNFTENCGFCGLLMALRAYFAKYAEYFRAALRQLDRSKRYNENWITFQLCFSLLQHSGNVLLNIQQFEKELTQTVLDLNKPSSSVIKYRIFLLNVDNLKEYESLIKCVTEGTRLSLLDYILKEFSKLCTDIHQTTYQVVIYPISNYLAIVSSSETWSQFDNTNWNNSELPDYSFSPQEYITQIGQYLIELPQHLEPFLFKENPSLTCALKSIDQEYNYAADNVEGALAQVFLQIVVRGTCNVFCEKILNISALNSTACRQLTHDINYLNNVIQDLGITLSDNLQQLWTLLKIPSDQYQIQSIGCSAKYVAAIRQIRNLTSN